MSVSRIVRTEQFSSIGIPGLSQLAKLVSIDVGEIGVGGAKDFFESKIHLANRSNKFEEEVRTFSYYSLTWWRTIASTWQKAPTLLMFHSWTDKARTTREEEGVGGEEEEAGGVQEQASQLCLSFYIGMAKCHTSIAFICQQRHQRRWRTFFQLAYFFHRECQRVCSEQSLSREYKTKYSYFMWWKYHVLHPTYQILHLM